MSHRQGGIITRSHTSLIIPAAKVVDFSQKIPGVTKISIGKIIQIRGRQSGKWIVKISDESRGCIRAQVTQMTTTQEIRIYTTRVQETKLAIARFTRNKNWQLKFGKSS